MNGINASFFSFSHLKGLVPLKTSPANRAAFFGDGVFETMVFRNGIIRFAKDHQERLKIGLQQLKILPSKLSVQYLEEFVRQNYPDEKVRIRWNVYRSGLGKYTPLDNHAQDLILLEPFQIPSKIKEKAYISKKISTSPSPWSHCKTLNALTYVMANIERKESGMDEVILLDDQGFVSEAGSANMFWVKDQVFYTPSLSCNCIAGVGRKKVIEALRKSNATVVEDKFTVQALLDADQIFTSNVTGIAYLAKLENQSYKTTPLPIVEEVFI